MKTLTHMDGVSSFEFQSRDAIVEPLHSRGRLCHTRIGMGKNVANGIQREGKATTGWFSPELPEAPKPPNAEVANLIVTQDNARMNRAFVPVGKRNTPQRRTFCNAATRNIANKTCGSTPSLQGTATAIAQRLAAGTPDAMEDNRTK